MTRRSLAMTAYRGYCGGSVGRSAPPAAAPHHADVWLHAETPEAGRALARLAARLSAGRPGTRVVATGSVPSGEGIEVLPTPPERPGLCDAFAAALAAPVGIWAGTPLRPVLIDSMTQQGTRLSMVDCDAGPWPTPSPAWLPDPAPATLGLFHAIHAVDETALRSLRRIGVEPGRLRMDGPLRDGAPPRECDEALNDDVAARLAGRPIWLAALVRANEAESVMRAHRSALRMAHRLMLIAIPGTDDDAEAIRAAALAHGMRICAWDAGEWPDDNTQVLLTEGPETLPQWFRLSPLAFLGGSLTAGHGGTDPFEAAALGSAILYGPHVGGHLAAYGALVEAGAARIVRDADSLAAAVGHLVAPDQAASMAHAGWSVVTAGALLADRLLAEIGAALDASAATGRPRP